MPFHIGDDERVVLDMSIIDGLINQRADALDVEKLAAVKRHHPVSIADGAVAELLYWFENEHKRDPDFLARVHDVMLALDTVLDPAFPIAPGGVDRLRIVGLAPWPPGASREEITRHSRLVWEYFKRLRTAADLTATITAFGQTAQPQSASPSLKNAQDRWVPQHIAKLVKEKGVAPATSQDEEQMSQQWAEETAAEYGVAASDARIVRLRLYTSLIARRSREASLPNYQPPKTATSNASMDADLLLYAVLPAIICANDKKFVNAVRALTSGEKMRVMTATELLAFLENGTLPSGPAT